MYQLFPVDGAAQAPCCGKIFVKAGKAFLSSSSRFCHCCRWRRGVIPRTVQLGAGVESPPGGQSVLVGRGHGEGVQAAGRGTRALPGGMPRPQPRGPARRTLQAAGRCPSLGGPVGCRSARKVPPSLQGPPPSPPVVGSKPPGPSPEAGRGLGAQGHADQSEPTRTCFPPRPPAFCLTFC